MSKNTKNIKKLQISKQAYKKFKKAPIQYIEEPEILNPKPLNTSKSLPFFVLLRKKLRKFISIHSTSTLNFAPKFKPLKFKKKKVKKRLKAVFLLRGAKTKFISIKKRYRRYKRFRARSLRNNYKKAFMFKLSIQKNPYILVRKNYTALFSEFFKKRLITPLSFDYLQLAYFKLNKTALYRPRALAKLDSYTKRMSKMTLKVFKYERLSPYQYLFTLIKKRTHFQKIYDLFNTNHLYNLHLHQLYYFQKGKKYDFKLFVDCPDYINPNMDYIPFNQTDALKFHEYKYIQKIKGLYYPVTEILFKETHIHGLPMKTKLPRRV